MNIIDNILKIVRPENTDPAIEAPTYKKFFLKN